MRRHRCSPVQARRGPVSVVFFCALLLFLSAALPPTQRALASPPVPLGGSAPLDDYETFVSRAALRAEALTAQELTRALDAVVAVHGPQDLRGYTARQAAERLRSTGWTDPRMPFDFDAAPVTLDQPMQRFHPAHAPEAASGSGTPLETDRILDQTEPLRITDDLARRALRDERYPVRWYALACLAGHPGKAPWARDVLEALVREPMAGLTRAYADALKALPVYARLGEARDLPGLDDTLKRLAADPVNLDARCLGLLLATGTGRSFPGADAALVLAQLARDYPVQSLEREVRALPPEVLAGLADALRHAWGRPQDRLVSLLARFPEDGAALEALAHALLNRNHPDYKASHRALVHTWEQLTGIPFKGSAEPFLQWYHAHKPMPPLPGPGG